MDYRFNKTFLVILSFSSLLLSSNAVPSTRVINVPAAAPKSSAIDFTSTSFPAKAPSSIDFISTSAPSRLPKVDPEITELCYNGLSTYETRCIETLSKLFQGPFDIDKAIEIVENEVNTTLSAAKNIFNTIIKLRNNTASTDKIAIVVIEGCIELYDLIVYQLSNAALLLPQKRLSEAYDQINTVLQFNGDCQDSLDEYYHPDVKPWDATPIIMPTVISVDILIHLNHINTLKN